MNQTKNVISNYVSVLLEEDTMETIRVGRFVRLHGVKGSEDFGFGDGTGEGNLAWLVNGGVESEVEGAVLMGLGVGQKVLEIFLSFRLENGVIGRPGAIGELDSLNSIILSSNDGLGMKERAVFIPKFNPLLTGFLVPKHFFLKEDLIIFILQFFLKKSVPH